MYQPTKKMIELLRFVKSHPGGTARGQFSGALVSGACWANLVRSEGGDMRDGFRWDKAFIDQPLWLTELGEKYAQEGK